jgi:DNA adenine methylase
MLPGMGYPGGKNGAGVYQSIINGMPPHTVYIEPFLGGGAIMRLKRPAALNIGLDRDVEVIERFRIRSPIPAMAAAPAISGDARSASAGSGGGRTSPDLARPAGADHPKFIFEVRNAIDFLEGYSFTGGELVYCDPPYVHSTRGRADIYKFEMTDAEHRQLLKVIRKLPCAVMISGYWTPLYDWLLGDWLAWKFQTVNRAGKRTTEWVWQNFAEPVALHDYRYLGENFRERERIKRKKGRWLARLRGMPMLERRALLAAIGEAWAAIPPAESSKVAGRAIAATARSSERRSR